MPACFDPPECVVITDRSSVAASGIANVSPIFRAITLAADDRLCGSLGPVNSERRLRRLTLSKHPILRRRAYALSPAFCCLDFPPASNGGREFEFPKCNDYYITTNPPQMAGGILIKRLNKKVLATDFVHTGSANWAFAFHCWLTIFHGNFFGFRIFALCATFYTIH